MKNLTKNKKGAYLKININKQTIFIPLHYITIVIPMVNLQNIPQKNKSFCGLLNYHGMAIPIFHLATLIDEQLKPLDIDTPIILCKVNNKPIGLIIDEACDVIYIEDVDIQKEVLGLNKEYIVGVYETEKLNGWILNLEILEKMHCLLRINNE